MTWLYVQTRDTAPVAALSKSISWLVLPSLALFIVLPLLLERGSSSIPVSRRRWPSRSAVITSRLRWSETSAERLEGIPKKRESAMTQTVNRGPASPSPPRSRRCCSHQPRQRTAGPMRTLSSSRDKRLSLRAVSVPRREAHGDRLRPSAVPGRRDIALYVTCSRSDTARRCCSACAPACMRPPTSSTRSCTRRSRIAADFATSPSR